MGIGLYVQHAWGKGAAEDGVTHYAIFLTSLWGRGGGGRGGGGLHGVLTTC